MKRIFLISLLFSLAGYCLAQEGTNFEDLTFKEALAKSQATNLRAMQVHGKIHLPVKRMWRLF